MHAKNAVFEEPCFHVFHQSKQVFKGKYQISQALLGVAEQTDFGENLSWNSLATAIAFSRAPIRSSAFLKLIFNVSFLVTISVIGNVVSCGFLSVEQQFLQEFCSWRFGSRLRRQQKGAALFI